jgi:hypothetical protein
MIRGHSWAKRTGGSDQVLPPSPERNSRGGQVPTSITSGCFGRIAIDQICMPLAGDSTRDQLSAPSLERNRPCSVPR